MSTRRTRDELIAELTEEFFRGAAVAAPPADPRQEVIPGPRSNAQIIEDQVNYLTSVGTLRLRGELHAEIDRAESLQATMTAKMRDVEATRQTLLAECRSVAQARETVYAELSALQAERRRLTALLNAGERLVYGLCTPSRPCRTRA